MNDQTDSNTESKAAAKSHSWRERNPEKARAIQQSYRERHPDASAKHYREHTEVYKTRAKQQKFSKRVFATAEERLACSEDPAKSETIRPGFAVCLGRRDSQCWQVLKAITHAHFHEHGFSSKAEYRKEWGLRPPIKPRIGKTAEKSRGSQKGLAQPKVSKGVPDDRIIEGYVVDGKSVREMKNETDLSEGAIHSRLQLILGGRFQDKTAFLYGRPMTSASIHRLFDPFGFTTGEVAKICGFGKVYLYQVQRKPADSCVTAQIASRLVSGHRKALAVFTDAGNNRALTPRVQGAQTSQAHHIKAVLPELAQWIEELSDAIDAFKECLWNGTRDEYLRMIGVFAARSRLEAASSSGFKARASLCWLRQLKPWLEAVSEKQKKLPTSLLVRGFLSEVLELKEWVLKKAVVRDLRPTDRNEIRAWSLGVLQKKVGRPKHKSSDSRKGGRRKINVLEERWEFKVLRMVELQLPRSQAARNGLKRLQLEDTDSESWKRALLKGGFSQLEVSGLFQTDNAMGHAQWCVGKSLKDKRHPNGLERRTIQAACYKARQQKIN